MSEHTPLPWYTAEKARWQADVRFVRTSYDSSGVIGCCGDLDAEFIVRACNAHDELLAAGKAFVEDYLGYINSDDYDLPDPRALLAAIAKAEGKSDG